MSVGFLALLGGFLLWDSFKLFSPPLLTVFPGADGGSLFLKLPGRNLIAIGHPPASVLQETGRFYSFFERNIEMLILPDLRPEKLPELLHFLTYFEVSQIVFPSTAVPKNSPLIREIEPYSASILFLSPSQDLALGDVFSLDILQEASQKDNNTAFILQLMADKQPLLSWFPKLHPELFTLWLQQGYQVGGATILVPWQKTFSRAAWRVLENMTASQIWFISTDIISEPLRELTQANLPEKPLRFIHEPSVFWGD